MRLGRVPDVSPVPDPRSAGAAGLLLFALAALYLLPLALS